MKKLGSTHACRHALRGSLAVAMLLGLSLPTWSDDLLPSTEVTARFTFSGLLRAFNSSPPMLADATLAAIEPASGAPSPPEGHAETAAESGPTAHGKSEAAKSFTGKTIGKEPPLPTVTIGGHAVITDATRLAKTIKDTTPERLAKAPLSEMILRRFKITPYAHDPQEYLHAEDPSATHPVAPGIKHVGPAPLPPIQVIEFVDLSCGQCMDEQAKIDAALQDVTSSILVTHIHAPMAQFQDTNMPAFYAKVAARVGVFWPFRAALVKDKPADDNAVFNQLVKSGVTIPDARTLMLNEARRFYRELDADALLARSMGVSKPPVVFVNGIRVGENGIPLELLSDVLTYVDARMKADLPEPPK